MIYNHLNHRAILIFFAALLSFSLSAEVSPDAGKKLFKNNCARCHAKNMKTDATGPALGGVQERWENEENLYAWIRNSQAFIATGDPYASALFKQWNGSVMNSFEALTDEEIGSVLAYVQGTYEGTYPIPTGGPVVPGGGSEVAEASNSWMYYVLLGLLGLIAFVLFRITGGMGQIAAEKTGESYVPKTLLESLTSKGMVSLAIFALIVFAGYTTVNNAVGLGRQQGYAPDQPIKFSHETHAGINKIDCQYCHDGARRSKHSVIPAANTCMNCHAAINYGSEYGTGEITKIYASVGWDPVTKTYIGEKTNDEIEPIYKDWIKSQYLSNTGLTELDKAGEELVMNQWKNIVKSLTNEQKKDVQGPIEWTRIHNLPDHVYFNHAQHVTVGKIECQDCHGAVEEMKVAEQVSPLSMGWCINCHRETEVQFSDNEYYKSYVKYHDDIASGKKDKVTVSDIGGLECQKCHY